METSNLDTIHLNLSEVHLKIHRATDVCKSNNCLIGGIDSYRTKLWMSIQIFGQNKGKLSHCELSELCVYNNEIKLKTVNLPLL